MIPYERQEKILQIIRDHEITRIDDIQKQIPETSLSTLRRDLLELEKRGEIKRLAGGAVKPFLTAQEISISTKSIRHIKEKQYIARLAAREVKDEDTVYVDSGSSGTFVLNELVHLPVRIVTSNTEAVKYAGLTKAKIVFLGGDFDASLSSVAGPMTIEQIKNFIFDKAFIGANGVDVTFGITTPSQDETAKKREVLKRSKHSYVLGDSSKFGVVSSVQIAALNDVTVLSNQNNTEIAKVTKIIFD